MADAENWLPHNLLAATIFTSKTTQSAHEAQIAITKGKSTASPAQLVSWTGVISMGHDQEAIQALNVFLQESHGIPCRAGSNPDRRDPGTPGLSCVRREHPGPRPASPASIPWRRLPRQALP